MQDVVPIEWQECLFLRGVQSWVSWRWDVSWSSYLPVHPQLVNTSVLASCRFPKRLLVFCIPKMTTESQNVRDWFQWNDWFWLCCPWCEESLKAVSEDKLNCLSVPRLLMRIPRCSRIGSHEKCIYLFIHRMLLSPHHPPQDRILGTNFLPLS